jgi:hypothetical protein
LRFLLLNIVLRYSSSRRLLAASVCPVSTETPRARRAK